MNQAKSLPYSNEGKKRLQELLEQIASEMLIKQQQEQIQTIINS
jgi:hypothetical protein